MGEKNGFESPKNSKDSEPPDHAENGSGVIKNNENRGGGGEPDHVARPENRGAHWKSKTYRRAQTQARHSVIRNGSVLTTKKGDDGSRDREKDHTHVGRVNRVKLGRVGDMVCVGKGNRKDKQVEQWTRTKCRVERGQERKSNKDGGAKKKRKI